MHQTQTQAQTKQPPVMTVPEVAEALQIGRNTAYGMCKSGGPLEPMVRRVGQARTGIRIVRRDFYDWLEGQNAVKGR
jgi:hypothetical protein